VPRVFPFQALTYDASVAGPLDRVTAPPYDVISEERRRELLEASPYGVVHLDLAVGTDDPTDPGSRYARAAGLLEGWEERGALVRSAEPSFFVYEMRPPSGHETPVVRGLLCAVELSPWGEDVVAHERTMSGPVEDRLRLLRATRTHLSPVYVTVAGPCAPLDSMLSVAAEADTPFRTVDAEGVTHRMWTLAADPGIEDLLDGEPLLMADGHHRYTTALRYRDERHASDGPGPWDRVLTLVVDASAQDLPVLPFHRIQLAGDAGRTLGREVPDLASALRARSDDHATVAVATRDGHRTRYRVVPLDGEAPAVRALHNRILDELSPEPGLAFTPDADEADAAVRRGDAVAAWFLPPTTPAAIRAVVERGERLPEKSTYFWPKPRTGMVMMPLDPPVGVPARTDRRAPAPGRAS
jgi:uncharacterized protein (DUF1015 family)